MLKKTCVEGYFAIPNFSKYGLSPQGEVINLERLYLLKPIIHFRGYRRFVLINDQGERTSMARHRLLGLVFIDCPGNPDDMMINHKNLKPGDDRLENLEWCTHAENMQHAKRLVARRGKIAVERKNIKTGEVQIFQDRVTCARESGLTIYQLFWRLEHDPSRAFPEGYKYRLLGNPLPWGDAEGETISFGRSKGVCVRDLLTRKEWNFPSQRLAAAYLDLSEAVLSAWLSSGQQPVTSNLQQVKHSDENWREVVDPYLECEKYSNGRVVVTVDETSGDIKIYTSAVRCAAENMIQPTLLSYRLSTKGLKVFGDGKRYLYYSDYLNSKWSAADRETAVNTP